MENPYQSPVEPNEVTPDAVTVGGYSSATQGNRFANYIIDYVCTTILSYGLGFLLGVSAASSGMDEGTLFWSGFVGGLLLYVVYYVGMEAATGKTIGKMVTRTRVVNMAGKPPTIGQLVGRTFARFIPFEPFSYLVGDTTSGWHDTLSGTRVVKA